MATARLAVVLLLCSLAQAAVVSQQENLVDKAAPVRNPCGEMQCDTGSECRISKDGVASCECYSSCEHNYEERIMICTKMNVTFNSECDLDRQRCLCSRSLPDCRNADFAAAEMDYFGRCKEIKVCEDWEMKEYPLRMRDWLYLVMEELARRDDLPKTAQSLAEKAQVDEKKWLIPVLWKFCDLDTSRDRNIGPRELMPITAPLKSLEHCTQPFLHVCDADRNGEISLNEWGLCLGLAEGEVSDFCEEIAEG